MNEIKKCICGCYTLKDICPRCGNKSYVPLPPKFSLEDKFGDYRRKAKEKLYKEKGYL